MTRSLTASFAMYCERSSYSGRSPFFESFFACFSFRFSFSDLPTFLELC